MRNGQSVTHYLVLLLLFCLLLLTYNMFSFSIIAYAQFVNFISNIHVYINNYSGQIYLSPFSYLNHYDLVSFYRLSAL